MKKIMACLLVLLLLMGSAAAEDITILEIAKYGNLVLSISGTELLHQGYDYGDVVTVQIGQSSYDMPIGSNYSDVDNGSMVCRVNIDGDTGEDTVTLAICMGDLATTAGIAVKAAVEEEPGYRWDYVSGMPEISFSMKEQGGYAAEYQLRQLTRTNAREDYAHLSDMDFANFRMIATTGMGEGVLYRSSSPVNPELGRNIYADAALQAAGVRAVVNLADSPAEMMAYPGYDQSAYAKCSSIALCLSVDVLAEDFQAGLAKGLRHIIAHEGPYLVHCTEGKDRAGFVSALLECLMGASAQEVCGDYMTTYVNYYGVVSGTEQYAKIEESNIRKLLAEAFGVMDIMDASVDLSSEAEAYLLEQVGLEAGEIARLKQKLASEP